MNKQAKYSFGRLMRQLRYQHSDQLSLGELAREVEVSTSYLATVEAGKTVPTVARIRDIGLRIGDDEDLDALLTAAGQDRGSLDVPWPSASPLAQRVLVTLAALGAECTDEVLELSLREELRRDKP